MFSTRSEKWKFDSFALSHKHFLLQTVGMLYTWTFNTKPWRSTWYYKCFDATKSLINICIPDLLSIVFTNMTLLSFRSVNSFSISYLIIDKTIFTIPICYKLFQNYFGKNIGSRATFADNKRGEFSTRLNCSLSQVALSAGNIKWITIIQKRIFQNRNWVF